MTLYLASMENADTPASIEDTSQVGAASIHWRKEGTGPPVVFLHGFPLSGRTWDKVVARLRDRFTCYTPDLVGLGQSHSTADEDYSSQGQARALQRVLLQLGVGRYALVGNDTGGWVARELALIDQPRISCLVLTNTEIPFHRPPWIPLYQALAHVPGFGAIVGRLLKTAAFRGSRLGFGGCFQDLSHLEGEFQERFVKPLITSKRRRDDALRFLRQMKFSRLDEFHRLHQQLAMPILLLWGADDPTFPELRARAMIPQLPKLVGFQAIAKAKLFVHEEYPDEVARRIIDFLPGVHAGRLDGELTGDPRTLD